MFPGKYQSRRESPYVPDASSPSTLPTTTSWGRDPSYRTSKARVHGGDDDDRATDILNLGLFRPIFSPTDFVQIKGRGTRKHDFR